MIPTPTPPNFSNPSNDRKLFGCATENCETLFKPSTDIRKPLEKEKEKEKEKSVYCLFWLHSAHFSLLRDGSLCSLDPSENVLDSVFSYFWSNDFSKNVLNSNFITFLSLRLTRKCPGTFLLYLLTLIKNDTFWKKLKI